MLLTEGDRVSYQTEDLYIILFINELLINLLDVHCLSYKFYSDTLSGDISANFLTFPPIRKTKSLRKKHFPLDLLNKIPFNKSFISLICEMVKQENCFEPILRFLTL